MKHICLAGGCFWGLEALFSGLPGVIRTECGYANGYERLVPDYLTVCSGRFGYREAVSLEYDRPMELNTILKIFFFMIDPTERGRQGNDIGPQYQTGIYWSDPESEREIIRFISEERTKYDVFETEVCQLKRFVPAEDYHQQYLKKNPGGYCHFSRDKMEYVRNGAFQDKDE